MKIFNVFPTRLRNLSCISPPIVHLFQRSGEKT